MSRSSSHRCLRVLVAGMAVLASCSGSHANVASRAAGSARAAPSSTAVASQGTAPASTTVPPSTPPTSTITTAPADTPFTSNVSTLTAADVPSSWRPGCPVGPDQLRFLHLTFWGFDGRAHQGTLVANVAVTGALTTVFRRLYQGRFPIRQMVPVDAYNGSDAASTAADNTAAFNCRYAVAPGAPQWSMHAYGEAIDVDPVENPYIEGGAVLPSNGAAYANRSVSRPGMAVRGGELVNDFAAVGWGWGGVWSSPDYQHFSVNGK
jgi:D-alanyl-D-alanine carboxypeptidase